MTAFELLYLLREPMRCLSECDIKIDDYRNIEMYLEFKRMSAAREKKAYIRTFLADKYCLSESSVVRVIRRFERVIKLKV